MRKGLMESIGLNTLLMLRDGLKEPEGTKTLAHLRALNHGVIRLVCDPLLRPHCTHQLFIDVVDAGLRPYRRPLLSRKDIVWNFTIKTNILTSLVRKSAQ